MPLERSPHPIHPPEILATFPMQIDTILFLLMPVEGSERGAFIQADERWRFGDKIPEDLDVVVWGRAPLLSSRPRVAALRSAAARERALGRLRLKPPGRFPIARIHRLPPPSLQPPSLRTRLRAALLGGALVELETSPHVRRVLDAVAAAAGATERLATFKRSAGGAILARIARGDSATAILRVGRHRAPEDPAHAADALDRLAGVRDVVVPTILGRGHTNGASWTVETLLPGKRPTRVSRGLAKQVVALCARLPRFSGPPLAIGTDFSVIASHLPHRANEIDRMAEEVRSAVWHLPGVMCHGDLWTNNLLAQGDRLTGLVDWDAWHEAGVPATDLLNLVAVQMQLEKGCELGDIWLERPWRSSAFTELMVDYWAAFGAPRGPEVLDAIGLAWWAARIAATLSRNPNILGVEGWARRNIECVLNVLVA